MAIVITDIIKNNTNIYLTTTHTFLQIKLQLCKSSLSHFTLTSKTFTSLLLKSNHIFFHIKFELNTIEE